MPLLCPNKCAVELLHTMKRCPECGRTLILKKIRCNHPKDKCGYRNIDGSCEPKSYFALFECQYDKEVEQ